MNRGGHVFHWLLGHSGYDEQLTMPRTARRVSGALCSGPGASLLWLKHTQCVPAQGLCIASSVCWASFPRDVCLNPCPQCSGSLLLCSLHPTPSLSNSLHRSLVSHILISLPHFSCDLLELEVLCSPGVCAPAILYGPGPWVCVSPATLSSKGRGARDPSLLAFLCASHCH